MPINRKPHYLMIGFICLALLLVSCRRGGGEPTARPSLTPTPRSTALPPIPTAVPLGSVDNPLSMKVVSPEGQGSRQAVDNAVEDLQAALLEETGLNVTVDVVETDAEALAALCDSPRGDVAIAWLGGLAYAAAYAQDCGNAVLQVMRGERASATSGDESLIIVNRGLDITSVGDLAENSFCRLGVTNMYSWLVPLIMLDAAGVSVGALGDVTDYDDPAALIAAVGDGDCDAAGISASQFEEVVDAAARARVRTLQESVTIPYSLLVFPGVLPLGERELLSNALVAIGNGSRSGALEPMLDHDELTTITDEDLNPLRQFVNRAGINLAQAGT